VEVGRTEVLNGRTAIRSWTRTDTDQNGVFRAPVAALGEYYIRAGSAPDNRNLTDTFYPGTIDIMAARTVAVRDWVPHTALDFELQSPKTFKISGRVVTPAEPLMPYRNH
jgi:hypothetical protein